MKIAIVDDDTGSIEQLKGFLSGELGSTASIYAYHSSEQFLSEWSKDAFDIVILDIFMGGMTGMDAARKIRETDGDVRIVFCTTSNEFASESYEVDACYYLHKPFGRDRVKAMLDRLKLPEFERSRKAELPDGESVLLRDIIYADFSSHRVTIHCKQDERIVLRASFSEIETLLCSYPFFFSPCKGVIVNFYEVVTQSADTFTMSDKTLIPISRRRAKDVLDAYSSFRFEALRKDGEL